MNKISFFVVAALILFSKGEAGNNMNKYNYGYAKYGKETIDSIQANGNVILDGTNVLGPITINGSFNADNSELTSINVNGQVDLKNSFVRNVTIINGSLNAQNTKFQKEISVATQKIILNNCFADSIIVRVVNGFDGIQIVDLRNETKVTGPIIVESGNGEIWVSSNSKISNQISGAKVIIK